MKVSFLILVLLFSLKASAQNIIDVTDKTFKIGGLKEEELYLGFAEGDKIVFNFQELDNKELKEVEILEYPSNSKFSDFKSRKIENKTITVNKTGVFIFKFKNSAIGGRICKINIQRIPAKVELENFNTNVTWIMKQDTTWNSYTKDVVTSYDTSYLHKTKREIVKTELKEEILFDKTEKVHSITNEHGNKSSVFFSLPNNEISSLKETKVISWAYWVGVDEAGNKAWEQNTKVVSELTNAAATMFLNPLGALAVGAISSLHNASGGEDVQYYLTDLANRDLFYANNQFRLFDQGKGSSGYKKFTDLDMCQGTYFILLSNDNYMVGISANVKVVAIVETNYYEEKPYTETIITPIVEKQIFKEPVISTQRVPVAGF